MPQCEVLLSVLAPEPTKPLHFVFATLVYDLILFPGVLVFWNLP